MYTGRYFTEETASLVISKGSQGTLTDTVFAAGLSARERELGAAERRPSAGGSRRRKPGRRRHSA